TASQWARAPPVAAPFLVWILVTCALVRISTPRAFAAAASAWVRPPIPPRGWAEGPAALESLAACRMTPRLVPADQGPAKVPHIPPAATAGRTSAGSTDYT